MSGDLLAATCADVIEPPGAWGMTIGSEALRHDLDAARAELLRAQDRARRIAEQVAQLEAALNATTTFELRSPSSRRPLPIVGDAMSGSAMSDSDKVTLFRSLFRGRDDVFPRHWANATSGRSGYAPACANEWVRGVCEKPRVKCGECPNRSFLRVDHQVIVDHLRGRHVLGVYPLLTDDTCWFLAADFDGETWREDVRAFCDSARSMGASVSVERSRSGKGAHVWLFFAEPVSAMTARQLGCFILTDAMRRRHQMPMRSYDRLFPNQDTLQRRVRESDRIATAGQSEETRQHRVSR